MKCTHCDQRYCDVCPGKKPKAANGSILIVTKQGVLDVCNECFLKHMNDPDVCTIGELEKRNRHGG